jgi:hypothetical protein
MEHMHGSETWSGKQNGVCTSMEQADALSKQRYGAGRSME